MNTDVILSSADFSTIHNALYDLSCAGTNVAEQVEIIRAALADCYRQENTVSEIRWNHYDEVKRRHSLNTFWSINDVQDLDTPHPFADAKTVTYMNHWGESMMIVDILGPNWADLYIAANEAINESGDGHHVFIEHFAEKDDTLILRTGS